MDILDRYLGYEAWTFRHFLVRCREVSPTQLHQPFDIGHGTLYDTIAHSIENLEVWTDLMRERPVRELSPLPDDIDACLQRFDAAMADFAAYAHELAASNRLNETYLDVLDKPPTPKTFGGTILHVLTHTTVHRWEMQHILQRLGLSDLLEGDALSWDGHAHQQRG
ncbi:MAG TPA: DinB family protein [Ktedonobacterales bacterium]|nr:DinB family protein [Ktedonobacterales bacterium]